MDWGYVAGYFDGEGTAGVYGLAKGKGGTRRRGTMSWANTNRESLEAMRRFIGCGSIRVKHHQNPKWKPCYSLHVDGRQNLMQVIPPMLEHCIVKRDRLSEVLDWATYECEDMSTGYGNLAAAGAEEVSRLYWDEGKTQAQIGELFGVTQTAVRHFMHRHGIPTRSRSEAMALANRNTDAWHQRSKAIAARRRKEWQDPEYREKMSAAMKAGHSKSPYNGRRNRPFGGPLIAVGIDEVLRLAREEGLSQAKIGERFGVPQSTVSRFILRSAEKASMGSEMTP